MNICFKYSVIEILASGYQTLRHYLKEEKFLHPSVSRIEQENYLLEKIARDLVLALRQELEIEKEKRLTNGKQ